MHLKDIAIVYRIYPKISKVPAAFPDDKLKMSELCLSSFKRALSGISFKLWVILDNCPSQYNELFKKYFGDEVELIPTPQIGNPGTFGMQMDILLAQNEAEIVYFAEDDYFYLDNAFLEMLEMMKSQHKPDFLTPYYHLDYDTMDLHRWNKSEITFRKRDWRTENTTCMTFMTTKKILKQTERVFRTYTRKNYDASLWLTLTKKKIFNPIIYPQYLFKEFSTFKILGKAWLYSAVDLLFGKPYKLYAPVQSLGTHLDSKFLAPGVDWHILFEKEKILLFN